MEPPVTFSASTSNIPSFFALKQEAMKQAHNMQNKNPKDFKNNIPDAPLYHVQYRKEIHLQKYLNQSHQFICSLEPCFSSIVQFLTIPDLVRLSSVCGILNNWILAETVWKRVAISQSQYASLIKRHLRVQTWYQLCVSLYDDQFNPFKCYIPLMIGGCINLLKDCLLKLIHSIRSKCINNPSIISLSFVPTALFDTEWLFRCCVSLRNDRHGSIPQGLLQRLFQSLLKSYCIKYAGHTNNALNKSTKSIRWLVSEWYIYQFVVDRLSMLTSKIDDHQNQYRNINVNGHSMGNIHNKYLNNNNQLPPRIIKETQKCDKCKKSGKVTINGTKKGVKSPVNVIINGKHPDHHNGHGQPIGVSVHASVCTTTTTTTTTTSNNGTQTTTTTITQSTSPSDSDNNNNNKQEDHILNEQDVDEIAVEMGIGSIMNMSGIGMGMGLGFNMPMGIGMGITMEGTTNCTDNSIPVGIQKFIKQQQYSNGHHKHQNKKKNRKKGKNKNKHKRKSVINKIIIKNGNNKSIKYSKHHNHNHNQEEIILSNITARDRDDESTENEIQEEDDAIHKEKDNNKSFHRITKRHIISPSGDIEEHEQVVYDGNGTGIDPEIISSLISIGEDDDISGKNIAFKCKGCGKLHSNPTSTSAPTNMNVNLNLNLPFNTNLIPNVNPIQHKTSHGGKKYIVSMNRRNKHRLHHKNGKNHNKNYNNNAQLKKNGYFPNNLVSHSNLTHFQQSQQGIDSISDLPVHLALFLSYFINDFSYWKELSRVLDKKKKNKKNHSNGKALLYESALIYYSCGIRGYPKRWNNNNKYIDREYYQFAKQSLSVLHDGEYYILSYRAASLSPYIREFMGRSYHNIVDLSWIDGDKYHLKRLLSFLEYHIIEPMPHIPTPVRSKKLSRVVPKWYSDFAMQCDRKDCFIMILIGNGLAIAPLVHLFCARIATMIKSLKPEEVREIMALEEDAQKNIALQQKQKQIKQQINKRREEIKRLEKLNMMNSSTG